MVAIDPSHNISEIDVHRVAIKLFFGIAGEWGLTNEQCRILAGLKTRATVQNWRKKLDAGISVKLSQDVLVRLSYVSGIYGSIQRLCSDPIEWKTWIHKPNQGFDGSSALEHMLKGRIVELADVRRYLDTFI